MQDLNFLLADESFQLWLSNKASQSESEKWDAWLNSSPQNRELYHQAQRIWQASQYRQADLPNLNQEWEKLRTSLNFPRRSGETVAEVTRLYPRHSRRDAWARFGAAAFAFAVLLAVMIRADFFRKTGETTAPPLQAMTTEFGQRATIHLPEGITVILNANSTLRYPSEWSSHQTRNVELQGEAYFSVVPPEKPHPEFWVHTSDGVVKVTGTQFAVYERGRGTRVVVETGKVHVSAVEAPSEVDREVVLPAGHLLQFQKDSPLPQPKMVSVHPYVTWWRDEMVFESVPFREIVQRLEETYGVEVRVSDPRLLERTLSGSIENQSLFIVTEALAKALRVSVKRKGRTVTFGK